MKTTTTLLLLLIMSYTQAQTVEYGYDQAGNRTSRVHNSSTAVIATGEMPEELLAQVMSLVDERQASQEQTQDAIDEKAAQINMSVFPNPATDRITLSREVVGQSLNQATVYLLDANGKIMDKTVTNETTVSFDVRGLAAGVYYVYFVDDFSSTQTASDSSTQSSLAVATDEVTRRAWRVVVRR